MMLSAALCAMSAALAASAAYAARKVVKKLEDVEAAVWFYADKVQAGEFRQDRAAGLQNDVSRKIVQAFQECRLTGGNCPAGLYLQRKLQAAMESSIRAAILQGVADQQLWWRCSVLEAKLCLCRDWLVQVEDGDLKNGCSIFAAVVAGQIQMHPAACPQTTIAEWRQLAGHRSHAGLRLEADGNADRGSGAGSAGTVQYRLQCREQSTASCSCAKGAEHALKSCRGQRNVDFLVACRLVACRSF